MGIALIPRIGGDGERLSGGTTMWMLKWAFCRVISSTFLSVFIDQFSRFDGSDHQQTDRKHVYRK